MPYGQQTPGADGMSSYNQWSGYPGAVDQNMWQAYYQQYYGQAGMQAGAGATAGSTVFSP